LIESHPNPIVQLQLRSGSDWKPC